MLGDADYTIQFVIFYEFQKILKDMFEKVLITSKDIRGDKASRMVSTPS